MYQLTLTKNQRDAFDWIGYRYAIGGIADILCDCTESEWDSPDPITFNIPEHAAWQIRDLAAQDNNLWPCFSTRLAMKLQDFVDMIV